MDWDGARRRETSNRRTRRADRELGFAPPVNPRASQHAPTDSQIAYLKALSDQAGQRYVPPLTRRQASSRIRDLQAALRHQPRNT